MLVQVDRAISAVYRGSALSPLHSPQERTFHTRYLGSTIHWHTARVQLRTLEHGFAPFPYNFFQTIQEQSQSDAG